VLQGPDRNAEPRLYPPAEPFRRFHLPVGDGHELYVELCGAPGGSSGGAPAVLVLHGGPGAGISPFMRRFFDPSRYQIVLFDQRGTGRSRPHCSLEANTTWHLVEDIERLRLHLDVDRWLLFGGSWGSTLAVLYAQRYPEHVSALVLRGLFTMTRAELDWFYGGGAARFYPDQWAEFTAPIPEAERGDLIAAYHRRLTGPDEAEQVRFARPWVQWETATASMRMSRTGFIEGTYARAFARIESHFFVNGGWLEEDGQILRDMDRIAHVPGVLVQGRYDMICPPDTAARFAAAWPAGTLKLVGEAGHALSEPGIAAELIRATDRFAGVS
jgi:proline iminopeptidase